MRLVDDHREALARQIADLPGDDRKFLQGRDDDRLPRFQRLLQLAEGRVDVFDDAERLLELAHCRLQLAVEHAPIGHHDDRVEDTSVRGIVQGREPMGEPGDRETLAAARGVLDQVTLPGAVAQGVGREPAHTVELLIARENQKALAGSPSSSSSTSWMNCRTRSSTLSRAQVSSQR
jgi:hypothetical protein